MTAAFYPIVNQAGIGGSPQTGGLPHLDGYFAIPGNFTGMFTPGFEFVVIDSGGNPIQLLDAHIFTVYQSTFDGANTRITPASASILGSPFSCSTGSPLGGLTGSPLGGGPISIPTPAGKFVSLVGGGYGLTSCNPSTPPRIICPGEADITTNLVFPGRAMLNFGKHINQDLFSLLENFACDTAPAKPIEGQIWYDISGGSPFVKRPMIYNGTTWVPIVAGSTLNDLDDVDLSGSPAPQVGDVLTYNGSIWVSLPPSALTGVNYDEYIETVGGSPGSTTITVSNVNLQASVGPGKSYQQVVLNGVILREGSGGSPVVGGYYVSGANQITINPPYAPLAINDEVLIFEH